MSMSLSAVNMSRSLRFFLLVSATTAAITPSTGYSYMDKYSNTSCHGDNAYQACDIMCKTLGMCYDDGTGNGLTWHTTVQCPNFCSPSGCTTEPVQPPDGCGLPKSDAVQCSVEGIYPDPYDCQKSLYCVPGGTPTTCTECGTNLGYNPCSGMCDVQLINGQCPDAQTCNRLGETKALSNNERMFYTCIPDIEGKLYPLMGLCTSGYLNDTLRLCVTSNTAGCPNTKETCSDTGGTTVPQGACTQEGYRPDPNHCNLYYYCDRNLHQTHVACLPNYHFDETQLQCTAGPCF